MEGHIRVSAAKTPDSHYETAAGAVAGVIRSPFSRGANVIATMNDASDNTVSSIPCSDGRSAGVGGGAMIAAAGTITPASVSRQPMIVTVRKPMTRITRPAATPDITAHVPASA